MKRTFWLSLFVVPLALSFPAWADQLSLQGNLPSDDSVSLQVFNVASSGAVVIRTFSYAGGTNGLGNVIAAGGFDPVLSLFDSAGNFLVSNNDGACGIVGTDPTTSNCFDAFLSLYLSAGAYTVALTENDNLALGPALADGFSQVGNGNFSCPQFLGVEGAFCDASPSQRNGSFTFDISTPPTSPVPEPAPALLLLTGVAIFVVRQNLESWKLS